MLPFFVTRVVRVDILILTATKPQLARRVTVDVSPPDGWGLMTPNDLKITDPPAKIEGGRGRGEYAQGKGD